MRRERHEQGPRLHDNASPGSRLAAKRVERGLTQSELARLVGISVSALSRIENGRVHDPGVRTYARCAAALRCTIIELLDDAWLTKTQRERRRNREPI